MQHDIVLQSLYPSKGEGHVPDFLEQSLCQARTDVFLSLLFGGRIVTSAGAFFDSALAVRVFGELFSHKDFRRIQTSRGWQPLRISTDVLGHIPPVAYLVDRWARPDARFGFFREFDPGFEVENGCLSPVRSAVVDFLQSGTRDFDSLGSLMESLYAPHEMELVKPAWKIRNNQVPAALDYGAGSWLGLILDYLSDTENWSGRENARNPDALDVFSPVEAIRARAGGVADKAVARKIVALVGVLSGRLSGRRTMNAFHIEAPAVFGPYYPLVDHWVEAEWHAIRHAMYGSATLMLSSGRHERSLLDLDPRQKIASFAPHTIREEDGSTTEFVGDVSFDWDVLFGVVDDARWQGLIRKIRENDDRAGAEAALCELIAAKLTDFSFNEEKGHVRIVAKRAAQWISYGGLAGAFCSTVSALVGTHIPLGAFAGEAAAVAIAPLMGKTELLGHMVAPGFRLASRTFAERELRRAVIPRFGAPPASASPPPGG